jgi:hypothetical protein
MQCDLFMCFMQLFGKPRTSSRPKSTLKEDKGHGTSAQLKLTRAEPLTLKVTNMLLLFIRPCSLKTVECFG